jgi:hypothetical protein
MNLDKLTMDELISLRNKIEYKINSYEDGYLYICSVRQFGSVWEERPSSIYALRELCGSYNGDNGIVDVYTNNPNLEFPEMEFYNYGDVMFIKSEDDYREWIKYYKDKNLIEDVTQRLEDWENKDNVPFSYRPQYAPFWTREQLNEWITEFETKNWDFTEPRSMKKNYFEDEDGVE